MPSSGNDVTFGYGYNPASEIVSNTRSNDAYSFTLANANVASTANGRDASWITKIVVSVALAPL